MRNRYLLIVDHHLVTHDFIYRSPVVNSSTTIDTGATELSTTIDTGTTKFSITIDTGAIKDY